MKITKEIMQDLRNQVCLCSLYYNDYKNTYGIDEHILCDFFDGYADYLQELMEDDGFTDKEYFDKLSDYDNIDNLWNYYYNINCTDLEREMLNSLFKDFINIIDFELDKDYKGYCLKDLQGANLGGIEQDRFTSAMAIADRLYVYIDDYFINDLQEELDIYFDTYKEYIDYYEKHIDDLQDYKWDFDILYMLDNVDKVDISKCL